MAASASLPLVGDSWVSINLSPSNEGPSAEDNEDSKLEAGNSHDDDMQKSFPPDPSFNPSMSIDNNIDPLLQNISSSIYNTTISPTTPNSPPASINSLPTFSKSYSQPVLAGTDTPPSTADVLQMLTSHTCQVGAGGKGKAKVMMDINPISLSVSAHTPSSSGSSAAHKWPWDINSDVSTKLSKASNSLICQIQHSTEAKTETKWMKFQAQIVSKELKAHNKNAQHKHDPKLKMVENEHKLSMATERTKQLELELKIEEVRLAQLEAERNSSTA
ncbi:hypothetical protein PISMIDRAFT_13327 [Pisolithus microcarpus 441]|uniref:Uncharacterized protein n=1 Tax=Pisolithus microcarpus 441 TaxID=765257 RepID=A0A0C9YT69_9AGAM|nr:hypothetical protein PISMIDRAFT_13327 [Pisolithus microcarpus 441]